MYKVLVADDEPHILNGMTQIINWEEYGMEIITACNGIMVLEILESNRIDIIITDIKMPKLDGLQLIEQIKKSHPDMRFIVLSGYDDFEYLKKSIKLGIENYLLKPVNREELISTLKNITSKFESSLFECEHTNNDISVIRNNILCRWIENSISPDELKRRALLIQIDIESISYCVCIVKLLQKTDLIRNQKNKTQPPIYLVSDILTRLLQKHGTAFCTHENQIVVILASKTYQLEKHFIKELMIQCLNEVQNKLNTNLFVAVGSVENDYLSVCKSYINACKTSEYHLVLPSEQILEYENIEHRENTILVRQIIDLQELMAHFLNNNLINIEDYIDKVFLNIKQTKGITPSFAHDAAVELIFGILSCVKQLIYTKNDDFLLQGYSYIEIFKLQSIDQISEWIKSLARNYSELITSSKNNMNPLVKRVLEYMKDNYYKPISLKTIALQYRTNASYLGQVFKTETGEFFTDYLNIIRIENAKKLLSKDALKSSDISTMTGFSDPRYFYRVFKKLTGLSPSEYKTITQSIIP